MRYRNTLTGAILDSSCVISGEYWELADGQKVADPPETAQDLPEDGSDEEPEGLSDGDVVDLGKMSVDELKKLAKDLGIDLGKATKKADIMAIIAESQEVVE
ncbi:MAG: Rho termination factor N-terminal domain-containing protein [Peptostreptococcaceae bacterium]|nr:Rho termination factor N-terminal domain-containing protein [Peptostreptococcaceae bacterium]